MPQIPSNLIGLVLFICTLASYVALQITGHSSAVLDQVLIGLSGLFGGHALGTNPKNSTPTTTESSK